MALFRLPWNYIPDPTRGKPLFYGKIYFGVADQDPLLFPKDVNLIQENGSVVVATQPILTSAGGVPVYNGSPVAIDLTGDYSIAIHDKDDAQVYYFANLTEVTNIIETSLRGAALRLNLDATLIGTVLVTNQSGQLLDDALYLQDTVTGLIYSLPDTIPVGSTVTSSSGTNLVTNNGSFTMHHVWIQAENRFKGNQNWNVAGSTGHPLPSSSPYEYPVGAEIAAGRFVIDANLVNATYDSGLFNADSGSYYVEYDGDFTNDYYGIKLSDDSIVTTGCTLSLESGKTRLTVDMSLAPAHKFPGLSSEPGVWSDINNRDSASAIGRPIELAYLSTGWANGVVINFADVSNLGFDKIRLEGFHTGTLDGLAGNLCTTVSLKEFLSRDTVIGRGGNSAGTAFVNLGLTSVSATAGTVKSFGSGTTAPLLTGIYGEYS